MTSSLPLSTLNRLQKLPQTASVWEGDRRPIHSENLLLSNDSDESGDCILWVDGSEGLVRSMDVIPDSASLESVVRTLIHAMEVPRPPSPPGRPQKIVVRNRELQFFLRGVLQGLDINIDYQPQLPLIDELFRTFDSPDQTQPESLPSNFVTPLETLAEKVWELAPWEALADHDILEIECGFKPEPQKLYACVMGMLGQEYGIIFYRTLDSLRQFRNIALTDKSSASLEQAFLSQDCWFLNYEFEGDYDDRPEFSPPPETCGEPLFGSIHPLEGIRPFLDETEAQTLYFALESLHKFIKKYKTVLNQDPIPPLKKSFRLALPTITTAPLATGKVPVTVRTLPDLADELIEQIMEVGGDLDLLADDNDLTQLRDDLIPDNSYMSLGMIPWELVETIRDSPRVVYQASSAAMKGDGMPVLMIQTSRPKAQEMIRRLKVEGEITCLCFNLGEDPLTETQYDLGIIQTEEENLYLFGEFLMDSPTHQQARKKWERRCKSTKGYCAVLIAMGVTGQSKGSPKLKHMLAYYETRFVSPQEIGMNKLQLMPKMDMDF